ncbi:unnamed protein product [Meloidogyne enterolobii]|uniref:Uncharacterized protein n=1 Tax=Meloidogyne enterolobii TaxID=390850 RepID=A0ACB0Y2C9_MELEN
MSYQGSSSISNGRRYDDVRKIPIPSKYHKSSKKDGKEESRHSTNLNYLHGGSNSTSTQKPNSSSSLGFESRNESLSLQLAAAQSQVIRLETELSNTNTAKSYAESRLLTLQREYNAVVKRNAEIVEVMKTLEIGVETLQQEKVALVSERDELKAKLDASENNSRMLSEQVTFLNERNSTLSKKCVDLLDGSKEFREKATIYEDELKRIKPRYEEMEANFDAINEKNRNYATRINMFEMRERIWIKEKTEMEERQKQNAENWQKIIADIRAKHETEITKIRQQQQQQQQPMVMGISKAEKDNVDRHSTDLRLLLDSIRKFHNSEVENFSKKIEHLEKIAANKKHPSSQIKQDYDDSILDDDDDVVVLLNSNTSINKSITNTEPIINTGQQPASIGINNVKEEGEKET